MNEKKLNRENYVKIYIEDFLLKLEVKNKLMYDKLIIYKEISNSNLYNLQKYNYVNNESITLTPATLEEKEKIIDSFFKSININFKLKELLENKTFEIKEDKNKIKFSGTNYYGNNDDRKIEVYDNNLLLDSVVWIHEIMHYLNQPLYKRGMINDIFTEAISFAYEFIVTDYLGKIGYENDSRYFNNLILNTFNNFSYDSLCICEILMLYKDKKDISKELYKEYCVYDDYEKKIEKFIEIAKNKEIYFINILHYALAVPLSIYMFEEYKKDNSFIEKIKELNDNINNKTVV